MSRSGSDHVTFLYHIQHDTSLESCQINVKAAEAQGARLLPPCKITVKKRNLSIIVSYAKKKFHIISSVINKTLLKNQFKVDEKINLLISGQSMKAFFPPAGVTEQKKFLVQQLALMIVIKLMLRQQSKCSDPSVMQPSLLSLHF